MVASLVDITDLKAKEASFRLLFEANPAPMIVIDAETMGIMAVNDAALLQYGWGREEMLALSVLDLLTEPERAEALAMRGTATLAYEAERTWRHRRADGSELTVLPYMREVELEGRQARLLAFLDVTDRERAEEELVRTKRLLDTVVEHVPTLLAVKNLSDGRYVLLNRPGELLTGWERERVIGRSDDELFPPKVADAMRARDEEALARGGVTQADAVLHGAAGALDVQSTRVVLPGPDGTPEFLLLAVQDVTERKAHATTLAAALSAAEQANRAKSEFLANMSHEIRTPLNGVLGIASVLERGKLDPEQRALVEIITSSATTLERLLSDILDLASVEEGLMTLETQTFRLDETVHSIAASSRLCAREKGLAFDVELSPECSVPVDGDPVRLRQILSNLLGNAIKFTEIGSITLRTSKGPNGFTFEVSDTGPGFSEEVRQRLFGRFQQADASVTRRFGGSGLGLAISRNLADLMGGQLCAESEVGRGSTFTLTLPLVVSDHNSIVAEAA
jgi:PAS domain S-box-containing protein